MMRYRSYSLALSFVVAGCAQPALPTLQPKALHEVQRIDAYLNSNAIREGRFTQNGPGSSGGYGCYTYHSGYLQLRYLMPLGQTLTAHANRLVLEDKQSGSVTRIALRRTPFFPLFHLPVKLETNTRITQVIHAAGLTQISMVSASNPGAGLLTLAFQNQNGALSLMGIEGVDVRGHHIVLTLNSQDLSRICR